MTNFVINYTTTGVAGFTPTGYCPPVALTFDAWMQAGEVIRQVDRFKNFALGDWLIAGEHAFGEMYSQAMEEFGGYDKLRKCVWVARSVPHDVRRQDLTWTHHHHVAKLQPADQAYWLQRAVNEQMSADELRDAIRGEEPMLIEVKEKPVISAAERQLLERVEQAGMTPAAVMTLIENAIYFNSNGHTAEADDDEPPYCNDSMYAEAEGRRYQSVRCPHCGRDVEL